MVTIIVLESTSKCCLPAVEKGANCSLVVRTPTYVLDMSKFDLCCSYRAPGNNGAVRNNDSSFNFGTNSISSGVPNPMTFRGSVWPVSSIPVKE